ncbi:MAG: hypothetical protein HZB99_02710 [Candidatus Harrisonbacteria bacterium]|nr:hypothetical protein [Candidatus Harrisonbacteria bacterium]
MGKRQFICKIAIKTAIFSLVLVPAVSLAQGEINPENSLVLRLVAQEAVKLEDLGIEDPGLLQSNPFYFMKNWRRSTQRVFKINPVQKADLELDFLNEKAAELKRLEEILPDNEVALAKALEMYKENLDRLPALLKSIKEDSSNAGVDRLLNKLLDRSLKHLSLFDVLKLKSDARNKEKLDSLQSRISEIIADTLAYLDSPESFRSRFLAVVDQGGGGVFKEFRALERLDRVEDKTPYNSKAREVVLALKEDLFLKIQMKIGAENLSSTLPAVFQQLPGDAWRRIKVLDEVREYLADSELKNDLGVIRQLILELASRSRSIGKSEAERLMNDVENLARLLKEKIVEANLRSQSTDALFSLSEFNLKQAKDSFGNSQYANAFGQASIAAAAARNALRQLIDYGNLENLLRNLKTDFDRISYDSGRNGLTSENSPELFKLLTSAEKSLANLSDLKTKNAKPDSIMAVLKDVKALLLDTEQSLKNLLRKLAEETEAQRASQPLIQRVLQ